MGSTADEDVDSTAERLAYGVSGGFLICLAVLAGLVKLRLFTLHDDSSGHLNKYRAILVGHESIALQEIADVVHRSSKRVRQEIQALIDSGSISDFYVDHKRGVVVSKKYVPKTSHKTVVSCARCGHANDLVVGVTKHCSHCGQFLSPPAVVKNPSNEAALDDERNPLPRVAGSTQSLPPPGPSQYVGPHPAPTTLHSGGVGSPASVLSRRGRPWATFGLPATVVGRGRSRVF